MTQPFDITQRTILRDLASLALARSPLPAEPNIPEIEQLIVGITQSYLKENP